MNQGRTTMVAQWLRNLLPMEGTQVRSYMWEDPTWGGAAKPLHHNFWSPCALEPVLHKKRSHHNEKLTPHITATREEPLLTTTRESPRAANKTQCSQKNKLKKKMNQGQLSIDQKVLLWMGGEFGRNGYMYMYGLVPLLLTWNYHNIVNWLYSNTKFEQSQGDSEGQGSLAYCGSWGHKESDMT